MENMTIQELQRELQHRLLQKILELPPHSKFKQKTTLTSAINDLPFFKDACKTFKEKCPTLTEGDFELFSNVAYSYGDQLLEALIKAKIIKVSFLDENF